MTGVDVDEGAIEYAARTYGNSNTEFLQGDAEDFTFLRNLGAFDVVVSIATMEHLRDQKAYLSWIRSALPPRGCAILCIPSTVTRDWAGTYHSVDLSHRRARKLIGEAGFTICEEYYQSCWINMMALIAEHNKNRDMPVPSISFLLKYYAIHPHHLALRFLEVMYKRGFRMADQQYLLMQV